MDRSGGWRKRRPSPERLAGAERRTGDLPEGIAAYREVLAVALPAVAEMAFVSLTGAADAMMVGRALGAEALAAVGLTHQPRMLMLCLFFALNTGVTAVVARRKGEGRMDKANAALRGALLLALGLSALLAACAVPFALPLMCLAGGNGADGEKVLTDAAAYFRITACALPLNALSMCVCAAQRGMGNTRATFFVNAGSNGINLFLSACLISGRLGFPRLEVRGAAIASAAGMGAGLLLALKTVAGRGKDNEALRLTLRGPWRPDRESLRALARVSGSAALEQAGLRLGYFLSARLLFSLGTVSFAANQICMHLSNLTFTFGDGLGVAGTALAGQDLGKGRTDLALQSGRVCHRCAWAGALVLGTAIILFRRHLAGWFIGRDAENAEAVAACAAGALISLAAAQPFQTSAAALAGCLRGVGENRYVAAVSVLCVGAVRPLMTLIAVKLLRFRLPGAWALGFSEAILRSALLCRRFSGGAWKDREV